MEHSLGSDGLEAIAQSVLLRCEYLSFMLGSDAPSTARTGLVGLNRTIYSLATRYLGDPVEPYVINPDALANRALSWYLAKYLPALVNVSQFVQRELNDGLLTPCCLHSGAPFLHNALSDWTQLDIAGAVSTALRRFWENPPTSGTDSDAWPDYAARAPGVGIEQRELDGLFARMKGRSASQAEPITLEPDPSKVPAASPNTGSPDQPGANAASNDTPEDRGNASVPSNTPPASVDTNTLESSTGNAESGKVRIRKLDAAIAQAKKKAVDSNSRQSVWDALYKMAASENRPDPLLGVDEGSIKWLDSDGQDHEVQFFTKKNLGDRLYRDRRRAEKARAKTR